MENREFKSGCGIDFGTTNSVAATGTVNINTLEGNRTFPLIKDDGLPHPSVVWLRLNDPPVVGREAKDNINGFSDVAGNYFVSSIKGQLGKEKVFNIFGQPKTAVQIAGEIFKFLRIDAEKSHSQDLREGIVTIPINFDGKSRRELRKAADEAGFYIKNFIHEPFAAFAGFCFGLDSKNRIDKFEGRKILVFDWGGGTLDITVATIKDGILTELATTGLPGRAGDSFDNKLLNLTTNRFLNQNRLSPLEFEMAPNVKDRFLKRCETTKIELSTQNETTMIVQNAFQTENQKLSVVEKISREEFEREIKADVKEAMKQVDTALEHAGINSSEIDLALLIGGTSNIPLIRQEMEERFGYRLEEVSNPDTIIAEGAAIIDALELQPALARSIGIQLSDDSYYEVFPAGTIAKSASVPKQINMFCTDNRDGQARLIIKERKNKDSNEGEKTLAVLPIPVMSKLKPHFPEKVTVSFSLDEDLVLQVTGKGATQNLNSNTELHNLCFGLRTS